MKKITLLGASGSIGTQAVELIEEFDETFELVAITANKSIETIEKILHHHDVQVVVMAKEYEQRIYDVAPNATFYALEDDGLLKAIDATADATVFNALVGSVGLEATLHAIKNNQDVLLANKESLVVGGPLIKEALLNSNAQLIPVDSEHAALRECLKGKKHSDIEKLVITASGGSFRDVSKENLKNVSKEEALKHPNWSMGAKITIDSATMMNKVFEVIEAHYLFDVSYDKIEAILHKESIVHGIVHFKDGNVLAHIGPSDMRIPILSAMKGDTSLRYHSVFDLVTQGSLHFEPIDPHRFSLFDLGIAVAKEKGMHVVTLNAANEIAVQRFLEGDIGFIDIETLIKKCLDYFENHIPLTLPNILSHDKLVRRYATKLKI